MENKEKPCSGCSGDNLVIACSGAADVGYLSDQVARRLSRNKVIKMSCLALVASCSDEKINEFKQNNFLVIDGCSEDCGKRIMEQKGISDYKYLRITDLGYEKGKTPTDQKTVRAIYEKAELIMYNL